MAPLISEKDLPDYRGKVVFLTGGNSGIGYATIQILARHGAKVYMATRNESRAKEAIQKITSEGIGAGSVEWLQLDLSDPRSAARAVQTFLMKEQRLDLLINNAAVGAGPFKLTSDGLLDIMVTNHISHVILTKGLLPLLKQTAAEPRSDVRIIALSSASHTFVDPNSFATRESLNKNYGNSLKGALNTYGYSKLACMLYFKALQKRFDADGTRITCVTVHPGAIRTPGGESVFADTPVVGLLFAKVIMPMMFGNWKDGALPVLYAAIRERKSSSVDSMGPGQDLSESGLLVTVIQTNMKAICETDFLRSQPRRSSPDSKSC